MITVSIRDAELQRLLKKMRLRNLNMQPLFTIMVGKIKFEVEQNFRMQGSYGDILSGKPFTVFKKWKKHSPLTAASRKEKGTGSALLMDSNRLRMSIGSVRKITRNSLTYGTDLHYAAALHFGAHIVPRRAKYLTVPYPGVSGRARQYRNTFFAKRSLFQKTGPGKSDYRPLFMLKESVDIPARPFLTFGKKTLVSLTSLAADYLIGKTILK